MNRRNSSSWGEEKLREVVTIVDSGVDPFYGTRMYVQTGDVNDDEIAATAPVTYAGRPSRANMEVQENDVLVARMKATKKVLVVTAVEKDYLFSTGFAVLRPKTSMISPRFLAYYFRSNGFQAEKDRNAHGATQKAINNSSLERMDIPLPPLDEQATIASALERVDRLLRNRRKAGLETHPRSRSGRTFLSVSCAYLSETVLINAPSIRVRESLLLQFTTSAKMDSISTMSFTYRPRIMNS